MGGGGGHRSISRLDSLGVCVCLLVNSFLAGLWVISEVYGAF